MRFPKELPDINQPRYDLPVVGPFLAFVEGSVEIVFLVLMGTITFWTYTVERYFPDSVVVIRHLDLIGVSFDKIRYKGLGVESYNIDESIPSY